MQYKTTDPDPVATATDTPEGGTEVVPAGEAETVPEAVGRLPSFLDEIASGMQTAVDRERERIAAETSSSLDAHVERIRERASTEVDELKRLAEDDVRQIRESAAAESERLSRETENRVAGRREDLERHLYQHSALVEREISGARAAVEEYQTELARFVGALSDERDPTEIARLARSLPEPPRVEEIASAARAEAIAELSRTESATDRPPESVDLVGVMDPGAVRPASGSAVESAPAQGTDVTPEAAPDTDEQQAPTAGGRRWADRTLLIAAIVVLVIVAVALVLAVASGQLRVPVGG
jgi:hypothetical protein